MKTFLPVKSYFPLNRDRIYLVWLIGLLALQHGQKMKLIRHQLYEYYSISAIQMQYGTESHIVHTCCDLTSGIEQGSRHGL
jgi:hypothetical protein